MPLLDASALLAGFSSERVPQKDAPPGCVGLDAGVRRHDDIWQASPE
jgi:hypothetical protein